MLTSAVSIAQDGNWTATTGQVYAVFLGIHVLQGFLGCSVTRVLARLQNLFVFANFAIIIATFAALPATTPVDERNSAQYIFGGWENISGWVNGFAFIVCNAIFLPLINYSSLALSCVEYWRIRLMCPYLGGSFKCLYRRSVGNCKCHYHCRYPRMALRNRNCGMHGNRYRSPSCLPVRTTNGEHLRIEIGEKRNSCHLEFHVCHPIRDGDEYPAFLQSTDVGI